MSLVIRILIVSDQTPPTPPRDATEEAFVAYVTSVGRVAYAWNMMLERFAALFRVILGAPQNLVDAVWHATTSVRVQLDMLKAAIVASPDDRWLPRLPSAKADLLWLADQANKLADARNNAVHAPVHLQETGSEIAMAAIGSKHRRSKNLKNKDLIVEFDWCANWAHRLGLMAVWMTFALYSDAAPWPQRPEQPNRMRRKDLLNQLIRFRTGSHPLPLESSQE